jgi:hypothetical protein
LFEFRNRLALQIRSSTAPPADGKPIQAVPAGGSSS